ncbi:hypothetical protein [Agaribacterium haliotis]|uniref:hypothetical protein n=1 Tax=Agaribacterium haliotis TaxID=2013869 RepID=UPI000BB542C7|nr:hypothetical protein [Agaribacterium haliotis]
MKRALATIALLSSAGFTNAADYCSEKITQLILDAGNINFKSSKTCEGWCRINPNWSEEQKNRAFSLLLAARVQDKYITMHWADLNSKCEKKLAPYSSPSVLYF